MAMNKQQTGKVNVETPFEEKHATGPPEGATVDLKSVFLSERPKHIIEDQRGEEMLGTSMLIKAGFGNLTQWGVRLKGGLMDETF